MSSELGSSLERLLSPRRTQLLLLLALSILFLLFRWLQRLEPWNSDDMDLFQLSVDAASGHHWVFGLPGGGELARLPHPAFRIGLLPVTIPAIRALGANAMAYYMVPLLFSLLGFAVLYWVMLTQFGPLTALVFAVIHVAWPFELQHSSVLLTDLPSAALTLVSCCLIDAAARRSGRQQILLAVVAGLAGVESHLLRNNAPLLLAPAYLLFFWFRPTRKPVLWASALIVLGVLGQQAFLVYRGLGWGADWRATRADFAEYASFLPIYSWPAFLVRQFTYQVQAFGRGPTGVLAALLVAGSLAGHGLLLRFERRALLLALAAFGLFSWLLFSFSIYERVPGGVRAMVPVNFRFLQPFAYSSLVVWAWAWCALRQRLATARRARSQPEARARSKLPRWLAAGALPLLLITFSYVASAFHLPLYREGGTRRLVEAIQQQLARSDGAFVIAGASASLQVPRMFCCSSSGSRHVEWKALEPSELQSASGSSWVLRDIPRELELARYLEPPARQRYREELGRLEERSWQDADLVYVDAKYALFAPPRADARTSPDVSRDPSTIPAPSDVPSLGAVPCGTSADQAGTEQTLVPLRAGRSRTPCAYSWLRDALLVSGLTGLDGAAASTGLVLRLDTEFEPPLSLSVELVEASERGLQRQRTTLSPGAFYVPVPRHPGVRALFVVYRLTSGGGLDAQTVRVQPARWRLQRSFTPSSAGSFDSSSRAASP